jgi:hypothetical protein
MWFLVYNPSTPSVLPFVFAIQSIPTITPILFPSQNSLIGFLIFTYFNMSEIVLVTGGTGFVATEVIVQLIAVSTSEGQL